MSTAIRERNVHAVLEALRDRRPASRTDIALMTGLSKPTVGGALRSFESAGLVREYGRTTGRRGPAASLFELVPDAVLVLGIDVGTRYVRALLCDLDGDPVEEVTLQLARPHADEVLESMRRDRPAQRHDARADRAGRRRHPRRGRSRDGQDQRGAPHRGLGRRAGGARPRGRPRACRSASTTTSTSPPSGNSEHGAGRGVESFAYLHIGSGLGAGIILHGRLHRGARGAAGEVGFLPAGTTSSRRPAASTRAP